MSDFKATNGFRLTRFAFYERLRFKLEAYENINHTNLKEINFSNLNLYGKIDRRYNAIYLNRNKLKQTVDNKTTLNFVSDAYDSVVEHFKTANSFERISPDEKFLSDIKCYGAYLDPIEQYNEYINEVLEAFNSNFIDTNRVKDFKQYLSFVIPYAQFLKSEFPITFSSWIKSKRCSPYVTGLYINISNNNHGNDIAKEKDFITSKNFDFYLNTCKSKGFYVAKSNPSVLIADIKSTQMKQFMNNHSLKPDFFSNENYLLAYPRDIEFLSAKLIEYYGKFINNKHIIVEQKISKHNKIYSRIKYINKDYNINYINNIIYKLYINIRNIEEDYVFGQSDIDLFIERAKKIEKTLDRSTAIDYINTKFRSTYASKYGGLNYYDKKFTLMEDE